MKSLSFYLLLLTAIICSTLIIQSCGDDEVITPQPVRSGQVSNVVISDNGDENNGSDIQISFSKATDETTVSNYRVFIVKSAVASAFTLSQAESVSPNLGQDISKNGGNITTTLSAGIQDTDGDLITDGTSYTAFVLSIADGVKATLNAISGASNSLTLEVVVPIIGAATNVVLSDVDDLGNGADLMVTFDRIADESDLQAYRIFILKSGSTANFDLSTAEDATADLYAEMMGDGQNVSLAMSADAVDIDGEAIVNDQAYRAVVLSVANAASGKVNALSSFSFEVQMVDQSQAKVEITYIANDGVMISFLDQRVMIDAVVTSGNLSGWVAPAASELGKIINATAPYNEVDLICVTHNHGDHYAGSAIRSHLSNNSGATLIAPSGVRNTVSAPSNQVNPINPARFTSQSAMINGIDVEVLSVRHFDQFGYDFSGEINFGYIIRMGGKSILHLGDVDLSRTPLEDFDLLAKNIDVVLIPTFGTLINAANRDALNTHIAPKTIIGLHLQSSRISAIRNEVENIYPGALVFSQPFTVFEVD